MTQVLRVPAQPAAEEAAAGCSRRGWPCCSWSPSGTRRALPRVAQSLPMSRTNSTGPLIGRLRTPGYRRTRRLPAPSNSAGRQADRGMMSRT
jgi:hypothetical protein